jgi:hypothetical protein
MQVDVRDHEKLCGEPIERKCGLKFAFKCNLVAHKKAHPACQDNPQANNSNSTTTSSSDDSEQSLGSSRMRVGCKRAREDSTSPSSQSSLHVPIPDFKGVPEAPEFKMSRHDFPALSFPPEANPLWASNLVYPTVSFTNLQSGVFGTFPQQFPSKQASYEAVNCEMGSAFNQLPFKAWSG